MALELPAKHALPRAAPNVDDDPASDDSDGMSDERMWALLRQAEVRLRKKAQDKSRPPPSSNLIYKPLPKLDVAPFEHRRDASDTKNTGAARPSKRTLDDPVIVAHKAAKVCSTSPTTPSCHMAPHL